MEAFKALMKMNMKRRLCDGFIMGYNIIFPAVMIGLLGVLGRNGSYGGITSYQYYGVVMIPFCVILSIITAAYAGKDDAFEKTAERIMIAPVSNKVLVMVKVISCSAVLFLCSILLYIVVSLIVGLSWRHFVHVGVLFLTLSFSVAAIGTQIAVGMKNFLFVKNVINIPILIFAVFGGTFFRIGTLDPIVSFVLNLSPLRWINKSLFMLLFDDNSSLWIKVNLVLIVGGIVFTCIAILRFKKGEYINGNLPGYEK